jgi:predicted anti-sigma-YlaC factor YlaD
VNDCVNGEVRDALPDFLNGRLGRSDAETVAEHVESCADCRTELELLQELRSSSPILPVMDVERIAAAIRPYAPGSAREVPARRSSLFSARTWQLAAAAAIVAAGGWFATGSVRQSGSTVVARVAETASGTAVATPATVGAASAPSASSAAATRPVMIASLPLVTGVSDLTDDQLEQLLADLDGMEAVPSAEPATLALPLDDLGGE